MGKKSIICPICDKIGTLGVERRVIKKRKKTHWEIKQELQKKFPEMSDFELMPKIRKEADKRIENIPTKKYERKRNPIFKIYHTKKVYGKPKTYPHYLGTNPIEKIEKYLKEHQDISPKIDLDFIKKLILDQGGDIKKSDDAKINKLIAEVIDLKNYLYQYNKGLRYSLKDEHECPHCEDKISIEWNYDGLFLKKSIPKTADPRINKKL